MFGMAVEQDIEESTSSCKTIEEGKRKAKRTLDKWLREPLDDSGHKFLDPAQK